MNTKMTLVILLPVFLLSMESAAQTIPSDSVLPIEYLKDYLTESALTELKGTSNEALALSFRQKFWTSPHK